MGLAMVLELQINRALLIRATNSRLVQKAFGERPKIICQRWGLSWER